jgi:hypothetical protein
VRQIVLDRPTAAEIESVRVKCPPRCVEARSVGRERERLHATASDRELLPTAARGVELDDIAAVRAPRDARTVLREGETHRLGILRERACDGDRRGIDLRDGGIVIADEQALPVG